MPSELLRFPLRALKARVAGFKPPSVSTQEVVLPYSPQWSVRALKEMMELLHSDLRASVVVRRVQCHDVFFFNVGFHVYQPAVFYSLPLLLLCCVFLA